MAATGEQFDLVLQTSNGEVSATVAELAAGLRRLSVGWGRARIPLSGRPHSALRLGHHPGAVAESGGGRAMGPRRRGAEARHHRADHRQCEPRTAAEHRVSGHRSHRERGDARGADLPAARLSIPTCAHPCGTSSSRMGCGVTHRVVNESAVPAPVAIGAHPYIRAGAAPVESLTMTVAARPATSRWTRSRSRPHRRMSRAATSTSAPDGCWARSTLDTGFSGLHLENGAVPPPPRIARRHRSGAVGGAGLRLRARCSPCRITPASTVRSSGSRSSR